MYKKKSKGLKPFIIQFLSVFICGLYIFSPLHKELSSATYLLVHIFEAPKTILSHKSINTDVLIFENRKNNYEIQNHNHKLADFVFDLLNKSNTDNKGESPISKIIKIDKHITYNNLLFIVLVNLKSKRNVFFTTKNKLIKGFLNSIEPPPKISFFN